MMLPCVGLASSPFCLSAMHTSQAVAPGRSCVRGKGMRRDKTSKTVLHPSQGTQPFDLQSYVFYLLTAMMIAFSMPFPRTVVT